MDAGGDPTGQPDLGSRRQGLLVLVSIAVALFAAAAVIALSDDPVVAPEPEQEREPAGEELPDPLHRILLDLGADLASAPDAAVNLEDAHWCGSSRYGPRPVEDQVGLCMAARVRGGGEPAVMVRFLVVDGNETVYQVIRSDGAGDHAAMVWTGSNRERFSGWLSHECRLDLTEGTALVVGCPKLIDYRE